MPMILTFATVLPIRFLIIYLFMVAKPSIERLARAADSPAVTRGGHYTSESREQRTREVHNTAPATAPALLALYLSPQTNI